MFKISNNEVFYSIVEVVANLASIRNAGFKVGKVLLLTGSNKDTCSHVEDFLSSDCCMSRKKEKRQEGNFHLVNVFNI